MEDSAAHIDRDCFELALELWTRRMEALLDTSVPYRRNRSLIARGKSEEYLDTHPGA